MVTYKDTKLLCCKRKHDICFAKGNSIFTKQKQHSKNVKRGRGGGKGSQRGTGSDRDGCSSRPLLYTKFKWASFDMDAF